MRIPQDTIERIRDRSDIVEVVSRYIELRRVGSNFRALCPFHQEKTPSFFVSPDRQSFHCFGCGKGGSVFDFVMEIEGVSFPEAVRTLGQQCGIEVKVERIPEEERTKNELLYEANAFTAQWYHWMLGHRKESQQVREYLLKRGISESSWEAFLLGYAPETWDGLFRAARKKGLSVHVLRELKLIISHSERADYRDYFRKRLMFPIHSVSGRVLAFGGRALDPESEPKYLNSPESPIFAKRRTLYGLNVARDGIRNAHEVLLVEGYTDCITLHEIGLKNTVASCGTAITSEHAGVLRRLARRVTLIPDADTAGQEAALAAGTVLMAAGLDVRVVQLAAGEDPDAAARALGPQKFENLLGRGVDYFEFLDYIMKNKAISPLDREAIVKRVITGLQGLRDPIRLEMILQELARTLSIDPESLRERVSSRRLYEDAVPSTVRATERDGRVHLEKLALRLLLEESTEVAEARDTLDSDDFCEQGCREFFKLLDFAWESNIDLKGSEFQRKAEEVGLGALAAEIALFTIPPGDFARLLRDTIKRMKQLKIRDELDLLREKLKGLPADSEEALAVAEYSRKLKQALSEL